MIPETIRLAILQRVCTSYRTALFRRLSERENLEVRLFIGDDIPGTKARNASDLAGLDVVKLPTMFLRLGRRVLPLHRGLSKALKRFQPDVILCEGESHVLGCLAAIRYRRQHRRARLLHWSLGGLPGVPIRPSSLRSRLKYAMQKRFDAMVSYSSFGRDCLMRLGHSPDKIFVATNVSSTDAHLAAADGMSASQAQVRARLGLPDRFTAIYAGAMDRNKRLDVLLEAADGPDSRSCNFVLLGRGGVLDELKAFAAKRKLTNVFFPGRVVDELPWYYRASDVLVLPGRGGMVISEAMAYGLPVIVFQADGTESDLVRHGETGILLRRGDAEEIREAIKFLRANPAKSTAWGAKGQSLARHQFNLQNMTGQIVEAVDAVHANRAALRTLDQQIGESQQERSTKRLCARSLSRTP